MAPNVLAEKISFFADVLNDLSVHASADPGELQRFHYEVERQVQLSVDLAVAIGRRILLLRSCAAPPLAREVFPELSKVGVISAELADRMAKAVGLRNLIVHEYGKLDYALFFGGLSAGFDSFTEFAARATKELERMSLPR